MGVIHKEESSNLAMQTYRGFAYILLDYFKQFIENLVVF